MRPRDHPGRGGARVWGETVQPPEPGPVHGPPHELRPSRAVTGQLRGPGGTRPPPPRRRRPAGTSIVSPRGRTPGCCCQPTARRERTQPGPMRSVEAPRPGPPHRSGSRSPGAAHGSPAPSPSAGPRGPAPSSSPSAGPRGRAPLVVTWLDSLRTPAACVAVRVRSCGCCAPGCTDRAVALLSSFPASSLPQADGDRPPGGSRPVGASPTPTLAGARFSAPPRRCPAAGCAGCRAPGSVGPDRDRAGGGGPGDRPVLEVRPPATGHRTLVPDGEPQG